MSELLPCPFCGKSNPIVRKEDRKVCCSNYGHECRLTKVWFTEEEWNTRAPHHQLAEAQALCEKMRGALQRACEELDGDVPHKPQTCGVLGKPLCYIHEALTSTPQSALTEALVKELEAIKESCQKLADEIGGNMTPEKIEARRAHLLDVRAIDSRITELRKDK